MTTPSLPAAHASQRPTPTLEGTAAVTTRPLHHSLVPPRGISRVRLSPDSYGLARFRRPMGRQMVSGRRSDTTDSGNWSGLVTSGTGIEGAQGTWTVPAVTGTAGTASSSWVGVDGVTNSDLIQTGTSQTPGEGYSAWWEILPAPSVTITSPDGSPAPVAPGDQMLARVSEVQPGTWSIYLADQTQNWSFQQDFAYSGPGTSAEWIEEAPNVNGQQTSPADFGSVSFAGTGVYGNFGNGTGWYATDMTASNEWDMTDPTGKILAAPGAPSTSPSGGQAFTDTYILPPSPPTGLAATASGTSISLSWQPPGSDGGLPVDGYVVYEQQAGGSFTAIGSTSSPSATLAGVSPGASYTLAVVATNAGGWTSPASSSLTVTVPVATPPSPTAPSPTTTTSTPATTPGSPGTPQAAATGPGRALVSWNPPTSTGSPAVTGYFVTAHPVAGRGKTVFTRATATTITGLPAGTFYFTVVAVASAGAGAPSKPSVPVEIAGVPTKVFVTTPAPRTGPGEVTIRVTTNVPGARVQLFDEPFGATSFFSKAATTATPSPSGNGVAQLRVHIARTNRFYATIDGVESNVVVAATS